MTTAGPDRPLTAADLLFGSSENAPEALTRHIMSAGSVLGRALDRLPRVTREAAVREAAAAAAVLLKIDLIEVLVAGWREHGDMHRAARRTLDTPGSRELVGLVPHRITTLQHPAVSILIDGRRVHTLQLGLSIFFDITGLVAGVSHGRLAGVHSGRGEVGAALAVHEIEVLTKRTHLELPGVVALRKGFRLLPASHYPDAGDHASHLAAFGAGQAAAHLAGSNIEHSASLGVEQPASQFPGVDLLDSQFAAAQPAGAGLTAAQPAATELAAAQPAATEHASSPPASPEHPGSGETDHPSLPWWEKTQAQPGPSGSPAP